MRLLLEIAGSGARTCGQDTAVDHGPRVLVRWRSVGVLRPTFARRYLVQAYRVLNGVRPLDGATLGPTTASVIPAGQSPPRTSIEEWRDTRRRVPGVDATPPEFLSVYYDDSSVAQISNTRRPPRISTPLSTRKRLGDSVRSPWTRHRRGSRMAGTSVHAPPSARQRSPDQPDASRDQLLAAADVELQTVLTDPRAATLHPSARGLLGFVHARLRPRERLTELSSRLEKVANPTRQDVEDYRWLLEKVAYCCTFDSDSIDDFDGLVRSGDLTDWILTTQASGDETLGRALQQWTDTQSPAWLVSVLWKIPPAQNATATVLIAAATIPRQSPAYATMAFLRVRLMLARGERDAARALLAEFPVKSQAGFPEESINLLKAARLQLANSLDELLVNSVRTVVDSATPTSDNRLLEDDASGLLTYRLPLSRLAEASRSALLPDRIRSRIAAAALSRALVLGHDATAREAAATLRTVAPAVRRDLDRYLDATTAEERHRAGLLIMLRNLGMHAYVPGRRDFGTTPVHEWISEDLVGSWWCTTEDGRLSCFSHGRRTSSGSSGDRSASETGTPTGLSGRRSNQMGARGAAGSSRR